MEDHTIGPDFVRKLYKMLDDQNFQNLVCWGPRGDCFVVKDMNEFTESVLPRMFKHSNFSSFVRQLNKYDFHKVKTDENQFGEHSWTFRHPDFRADRRNALKNIKRKGPTPRKSTFFVAPYEVELQNARLDSLEAQITSMDGQIASLDAAHGNTLTDIQRLAAGYQDTLVEMVGVQRSMEQQHLLLQNLVRYCLSENNGNCAGE
ncbi:winged helix DNA-binding domain-containing protein [Mycena maculata]|uniref:Winged helix DNA-binding domain-containing protein n=1 Tax=Mycena maculata TaxID=230809 RepID=A0AAD7J1E6_9AGAR|nr:winged helix DNA-binding domain-containing protein [Mycena maculata]